MEILGLAVLSIAVGFFVGVLSGMLGLGGGTVLVPIFKLGYAMDAIASTATSLFTIIPTSISGMITHIRNKTCIPALGVAAGIGGAITSPVGVWLASISPEWTIMVAAALVIAYSASTMFQKAIKGLKQDRAKKAADVVGACGSSGSVDAGDAAHVADVSVAADATDAGNVATVADATDAGVDLNTLKTRRNIILCAIIGLIAGVMSGYVGVGGGFIMVPLFMQLLNLPIRLTSGTSLIAILILATSGTVLQAIYGNIDWVAGIFIAVGSIPGAYLGSRLITRIPETVLRFIFSGFLIVAAGLLVLNQMGVF
ncbi:MAG: sulfite exporter TauE/SafE family protein [Eggerthellaceae bacterium]|nr:sulfite exporter TauE/SafE family protein [Eggerthellaceae bacterium]